jgi:MSHA biogenesis protein MshL
MTGTPQPTLFPRPQASVLLLAGLLSACGATRPQLEPARPWEVATQAVNHPPQLIDVIKPNLGNHGPMSVDNLPQLKEKVTLRSEAIDIRSLMLGLAKQTGLNITLDPSVTGQVSAYFTDVEVLTALEQIAEQLDAEVEVKGNVISVRRPRPEVRMYRLSYLRNVRAGFNAMTVLDRATTSTPGGGTVGAGAGNGGGAAPTGGNITGKDSTEKSTGTIALPPKATITPGDSVTYLATAFTSNFWEDLGEQLKAIVFEGDLDKDIFVQNNHSAGMTASDPAGRSLVIDSMSGTIVVKAHRRILDELGEYIKAVDITIHRQVIIDVRILEVSLSDQTVFGIESQNLPLMASGAVQDLSNTIWGFPGKPAGPDTQQWVTTGYTTPLGFPSQQSVATTVGTTAGGTAQLTPASQPVGFTFGGTYITPNSTYKPGQAATPTNPNNPYVTSSWELLVQMLGSLTDTKLISSPRLTALHNQRALIKVVRDRVFYLFTPGTVTPGQNGNRDIITPSVAYPILVPEGVLMDITPLIDDNGEVTLEIHPSFSTIVDEKVTPGNQGSEPEVERREFQTTVHVKGEETVMLGGLVSEYTRRVETGIPYLKDIPFLGGLFRTTSDLTKKSEIILLLTPRVQGPTVARDFVNGLRTLSDQDPIPVVAPPPEVVTAPQAVAAPEAAAPATSEPTPAPAPAPGATKTP